MEERLVNLTIEGRDLFPCKNRFLVETSFVGASMDDIEFNVRITFPWKELPSHMSKPVFLSLPTPVIDCLEKECDGNQQTTIGYVESD